MGRYQGYSVEREGVRQSWRTKDKVGNRRWVMQHLAAGKNKNIMCGKSSMQGRLVGAIMISDGFVGLDRVSKKIWWKTLKRSTCSPFRCTLTVEGFLADRYYSILKHQGSKIGVVCHWIVINCFNKHVTAWNVCWLDHLKNLTIKYCFSVQSLTTKLFLIDLTVPGVWC